MMESNSEVVSRVVEAIGECMVGSSLEDQAAAALEASHHAELVEALRRSRSLIGVRVGPESSASIGQLCEQIDTLLAKIGGK